MNFIQNYTKNFQDIAERVINLTLTKENFEFSSANDEITNLENYSDYGLRSLGASVNFPARFIREIDTTNPTLAENIVKDRVNYYFEKHPDKTLVARRFGKDKEICGIVSDTYSYFDDDEVIDIIDNSPLSDLTYKLSNITPERLHLRAVDKESFKVPTDNSPLFFSYFIDNSMVGAAAFKITLGLYRQACSNGMIVPVKEFVLCKQVHRGTSDISAAFNESIKYLDTKKSSIKELLINSTSTQSALEKLENDFKLDYLSRKLSVGKKESEKIIQLYDQYSNEYGARSKWSLANAITEYARDLSDINKREFIEQRAILVA